MAILDVMDAIGGKWKLSIIALLCEDKMRYSELLKNIDGISGKVLSRELKELEMNHFISREVISSQPIAVEYSITEYGMTLKELINYMAEWGFKHRMEIIGKPVSLGEG